MSPASPLCASRKGSDEASLHVSHLSSFLIRHHSRALSKLCGSSRYALQSWTAALVSTLPSALLYSEQCSSLPFIEEPSIHIVALQDERITLQHGRTAPSGAKLASPVHTVSPLRQAALRGSNNAILCRAAMRGSTLSQKNDDDPQALRPDFGTLTTQWNVQRVRSTLLTLEGEYYSDTSIQAKPYRSSPVFVSVLSPVCRPLSKE